MFDPNKNKAAKAAKLALRKQENRIKEHCLSLIPEAFKDGLLIDVKEIICGDPECAPIDTVITLVWEPIGKGIFALPYSTSELTNEDLEEMFPDEETLGKWKQGKIGYHLFLLSI
jgi:hypothetical protein